MCRQVSCPRCEKASWSGCGQHVDQVMAGVPRRDRCRCTPQEMSEWKAEHSLFRRLFGGGATSRS